MLGLDHGCLVKVGGHMDIMHIIIDKTVSSQVIWRAPLNVKGSGQKNFRCSTYDFICFSPVYGRIISSSTISLKKEELRKAALCFAYQKFYASGKSLPRCALRVHCHHHRHGVVHNKVGGAHFHLFTSTKLGGLYHKYESEN